MAKHMVTCVQCGKRFDANMGGYYNSSSRRYTCKSCGSKIKKANKQAEANLREQRTGMRQSLGAMIAKIAIGAFFVISGIGDSVSTFLVGLIIGGALIAWGLIPYLQARKAKQEAQAEYNSQVEAARTTPKQCPNCGAFTVGNFCEYCGSPLQ